MFSLSKSELLLFGGFATMAAVILLAGICFIVFRYRWKKLTKKLEQDYGKPWKYYDK